MTYERFSKLPISNAARCGNRAIASAIVNNIQDLSASNLRWRRSQDACSLATAMPALKRPLDSFFDKNCNREDKLNSSTSFRVLLYRVCLDERIGTRIFYTILGQRRVLNKVTLYFRLVASSFKYRQRSYTADKSIKSQGPISQHNRQRPVASPCRPQVEAMDDIAGVRARFPCYTITNALSTSTTGAGLTAGPFAVGLAPVRERGTSSLISVAACPVLGADLPARILG